MKRILLDYKYEPEFGMIGIFSPLKDYRLAWLMNQHMGYDLKLLPVFHWQQQSAARTYECALYKYENPVHHLQVYLLNNRSSQGKILPEPRNLDYLLLLKNPGQHIHIPNLVKIIRALPMVQTAVSLESPDKLTRELMFDLEMFLEKQQGDPAGFI